MEGLLLWGPGATTPAAVVSHLVAMQAQEDRFARWSVAQRTRVASPTAVDEALNEGAILRTHVLRPTWHYVAATELRWLLALSGPRVDRGNAPRYRELGLDPHTLDRANEAIAGSVAEGARTRYELRGTLGAAGISTEEQRLAHLLIHAELTRVICSGPRRGRHHTYAAFDDRVPPDPGPQGEEALGELAYRYFSTRGPATAVDFAWWAGLTLSDARLGLELAGGRLDSAVIDGRPLWWSGDLVTREREGRIDLVQCYDEIAISYSESRDVLYTETAKLTVPGMHDGFAHVTLLDGRLFGHWRAPAVAGDRTVVTRPMTAPDPATDAALAREVERCQGFLSEQERLLARPGESG